MPLPLWETEKEGREADGRNRKRTLQLETKGGSAANCDEYHRLTFKKDKKIEGEAFSTIGNDLPIEEDVSRGEEMSP